MANPQLENGYTRIANEILLALAQSGLSGSERGVLDIVFRCTYGFNKKTARISADRFAKECKISQSTAKKTINNLILKKVLIEISPPDFSNPREIMFNKNYCEWGLKDNTGEKNSLYLKQRKTRGTNRATPGVLNEPPHIKKQIKENYKKSSRAAALPPQLSEILSFISEEGLNVDGEKFFARYTENGWKTEDGKEIKDWRRLLRIWDSKEMRDKPVYQNGYAGVKNLADD